MRVQRYVFFQNLQTICILNHCREMSGTRFLVWVKKATSKFSWGVPDGYS